MLIRFTLDEQGFVCVDAPVIASAPSINYLKCRFEFKHPDWKGVDAVTAVFKSPTYNIVAEVMLDSNNECYVDPEVYKHGGIIQCKLVGDKYLSDRIVSSSHITDIIEFYVNENVIIPTPIPSKYDVFVAELEKAEQSVEDIIDELNRKLADGDFDGVGISNIIYNSDYTITVVLTDGSQYITGVLRGSDGEQGAPGQDGRDGVGISNITFNSDYTLTITLEDGTEYTTLPIRGEQGAPGDVSDVLVGGNSLVTDGEANIPYASDNRFGVVAVGKSLDPDDSYEGTVIVYEDDQTTVPPTMHLADLARTSLATTSKRGLMSATDKIKLDRIPDPPSADGSYSLNAVVSDGVATLSWVPAH